MRSSARAGTGADSSPVEGEIGASSTDSSTVLKVPEDEVIALLLWTKAMRSASDVMPMRVGPERGFTRPLEEFESARLDLAMGCYLVPTLTRILAAAGCLTPSLSVVVAASASTGWLQPKYVSLCDKASRE